MNDRFNEIRPLGANRSTLAKVLPLARNALATPLAQPDPEAAEDQ